MQRKIKFNKKEYKELDVRNYLKEALFECNSEEHMSELVESIVERFKNAKNPAIICVGTKKVYFDSFGPTLYDAFLELGVDEDKIYWFHGANASKVIPKIKDNNHDVTIAFDAEVLTTRELDVMKLRFRDMPIAPGAGCGKCIEKVGDFSITLPIGFKSDLKTLMWNDHILYDIKDIQKISKAFAKVFLEKVSTSYNFVKEPNKNLS